MDKTPIQFFVSRMIEIDESSESDWREWWRRHPADLVQYELDYFEEIIQKHPEDDRYQMVVAEQVANDIAMYSRFQRRYKHWLEGEVIMGTDKNIPEFLRPIGNKNA